VDSDFEKLLHFRILLLPQRRVGSDYYGTAAIISSFSVDFLDILRNSSNFWTSFFKLRSDDPSPFGTGAVCPLKSSPFYWGRTRQKAELRPLFPQFLPAPKTHFDDLKVAVTVT